MHFKRRNYINLFLIIALVVLSISVVLSYLQIGKLLVANQMVQHTHQVLEKTYGMKMDFVLSTRSIRKYFISGDPNSLVAIPTDIQRLQSQLSELKKLTKDNSTQQANFKELDVVAGSIFAKVQSIYDQRLTDNKIGRVKLMNEFFALIDNPTRNIIIQRIYDRESLLLQQRSATFEYNANQTLVFILVTGVLGIIFLILCIVLINFHLSQLQAAEKHRQATEARLKNIIDSSSDLVAAIDNDFNFIVFNKAYEKVFYEILGKRIRVGANLKTIIGATENHAEILKPWIETLAGHNLTAINTFAHDKTSDVFYEATYTPIISPDGVQLGASHIMRDVTARKKVELLKNEFVSVVSHELRTPLTSIRGALGLILGGVMGELNDKIIRMLNIAYVNAERLIALINDILDVEKIESGKMDLLKDKINLVEIISQAVGQMDAYAEKFGVRIKTIGASAPIYVNADYDRLIQVMTNLISNATKFSSRGDEIVVMLKINGDRVRTSVTDFGSGVPLEFQQHLFKKFSQADSSSMRQTGGSGLGLSICKSIIESLGGEIGFEVGISQETIFYFELPLAEAQSEVTMAHPSSIFHSRNAQANKFKVLYIEDDWDLALIVKRLLVNDAEIICVENKISALEKLSLFKYDLIIIDIMVADGSILEIFPQIQKSGSPIIVFSAYDLPKEYSQKVSKVLIKSKITNVELTNSIKEVLFANENGFR